MIVGFPHRDRRIPMTLTSVGLIFVRRSCSVAINARTLRTRVRGIRWEATMDQGAVLFIAAVAVLLAALVLAFGEPVGSIAL